MALNQSPVSDDFLRISGLPFSSKCLIWKIYCTKKIAKIVITKGSFLATEQHLKRSNRPLTQFSITVAAGSLFCIRSFIHFSFITFMHSFSHSNFFLGHPVKMVLNHDLFARSHSMGSSFWFFIHFSFFI